MSNYERVLELMNKWEGNERTSTEELREIVSLLPSVELEVRYVVQLREAEENPDQLALF